MPPALLERHGIEPAEVAPVNEAFAAGDVKRALDATPEEVADRIMVAGTPEDWVEWLTEYARPGLNHALVSFTDPFTLKAWAGSRSRGCPIWASRFGSSASRSCPTFLDQTRPAGQTIRASGSRSSFSDPSLVSAMAKPCAS